MPGNGVLGAAPLLSTFRAANTLEFTPLPPLLFSFSFSFSIFFFFFPFPILQQLVPSVSCPLGRVQPAGCTAMTTSLQHHAAAGLTPWHLPDLMLLGAPPEPPGFAFSSPTGITISVGSAWCPTRAMRSTPTAIHLAWKPWPWKEQQEERQRKEKQTQGDACLASSSRSFGLGGVGAAPRGVTSLLCCVWDGPNQAALGEDARACCRGVILCRSTQRTRAAAAS